MNIHCRKTNCKNNAGCACQCNVISVSNNMKCSSFKKGKEPKVKKNLFELADEKVPVQLNKKSEIKCKADCVFNKNGCCMSNGITVNEIKSSPLCINFLQK